MTDKNEENDNHFEDNQSDNSLQGDKKNIFIKIIDWCKRSFLHPTCYLLPAILTILFLLLIYNKQNININSSSFYIQKQDIRYSFSFSEDNQYKYKKQDFKINKKINNYYSFVNYNQQYIFNNDFGQCIYFYDKNEELKNFNINSIYVGGTLSARKGYNQEEIYNFGGINIKTKELTANIYKFLLNNSNTTSLATLTKPMKHPKIFIVTGFDEINHFLASGKVNHEWLVIDDFQENIIINAVNQKTLNVRNIKVPTKIFGSKLKQEQDFIKDGNFLFFNKKNKTYICHYEYNTNKIKIIGVIQYSIPIKTIIKFVDKKYAYKPGIYTYHIIDINQKVHNIIIKRRF